MLTRIKADLYLATGILTTVTIDFDSTQLPLCDLKMSQATYVDGDIVTADVFRYAKLTGAPTASEVKIWLGVPGVPPISVTNVGADGSLVFPAGTDVDLGPVPLFRVAGLPPGSYELGCRMLDPVTGGLLWEDLNLSIFNEWIGNENDSSPNMTKTFAGILLVIKYLAPPPCRFFKQ